MKVWHGWVLGMLIGIGVGCDEKPQPPQRAAENSAQPAARNEDFRPKAGEIAAAPFRTIQLSDYPLTVDVPPRWQVESMATTKLLRGPIPHGPLPDGIIHVMLSRQPAFSKDSVASMEASEKKAAAENPDRIRVLEFRDLAGARLLEKQVVEPADPASHLPAMMKWEVRVFVESEKDQFTLYVLKFIDLPLETYEQDKQVLQPMVASLRYDPAPALKIGK
jgi:hypothetical protein